MALNQEHDSTDHHVKIGVLWNGGWDVYIVDSTTMREPSEEEALVMEHDKLFPIFLIDGEKWLKFHFSPKMEYPEMIVKIVNRVAGGD